MHDLLDPPAGHVDTLNFRCVSFDFITYPGFISTTHSLLHPGCPTCTGVPVLDLSFRHIANSKARFYPSGVRPRLQLTGILARWLGVPCLLGAFIAAWGSPIYAHDFSNVRLINMPAGSTYFGRYSPPGESVDFHVSARTQPAPSRLPNQMYLLDDARDPLDSKPGLIDMVEFSQTPFVQQVRMPLGSFWRGRINLGGFNAVTPTESIERGLPGGGSLDAWAPNPMGRAGMVLLKDDNSYGLSLTFYYAGIIEDARNAKLNVAVQWLAEKNPVTWLIGSNPR